MKTLIKFLLAIVCVFMLFACSKSNDDVVTGSQSSLKSVNTKGNGSVSTFWVWDSYWQPVYCGDEIVDYLIGTANVHTLLHLKNGNPIFENVHIEGLVQSTNSKEEFKFSEHDKLDYASGILNWHFNLIGNYGTHYIGTMTWDYVNDPNMEHIVVGKTMCLENKGQ